MKAVVVTTTKNQKQEPDESKKAHVETKKSTWRGKERNIAGETGRKRTRRGTRARRNEQENGRNVAERRDAKAREDASDGVGKQKAI